MSGRRVTRLGLGKGFMFRVNKSKIIRLVLNNQFSVFGNVTLASHFHCCFKLQIKTKGRSFVLKTKGSGRKLMNLRLSCSTMRIFSWSRTVLRMRSLPADMFLSSFMVNVRSLTIKWRSKIELACGIWDKNKINIEGIKVSSFERLCNWRWLGEFSEALNLINFMCPIH